MAIELEAMPAETETDLAGIRDQMTLKMLEMKLQIEEAESSCHGSTVSPSVMSLSIDENRNSDIESWLDQNSDVMDFQKQHSQIVVETAKRDTDPVISSEPLASRSRGQPPEVIDRKDPSSERKGRRLNDREGRSQIRSKSRTFSPKRHLNANCEVPNRVSRRVNSLPIQQPTTTCPAPVDSSNIHYTEISDERLCR